MAYIVGLMATDGCLISGRKQLNFKSEDEQLVQTFLQCLGKPPTYGVRRTRRGRVVFVAQFGDARFYEWLQAVGLTPRKSLTLGPLAVPSGLLHHCARGLLDGDGSILNYWYDGTGKAKGRRYEGFRTVFLSASRSHVEWLRAQLTTSLGVMGALVPRPPTERGTVMWTLAYAIRESAILLPHLYPSRDVPCLRRKWSTWESYAIRHDLRPTLGEPGFAEETAPYAA